MRVILVNPHLRVGGAERQILNLAKGFARSESIEEISLFIMKKDGGFSKELSPETEKKIIYPKTNLSDKWPLKPILQIVAIWRAARDFKPDVIYSRIMTFSPAIAGKILGIPVVIAEITNPSRKWGKSLWTRTRFVLWAFLLQKLSRQLSAKLVANSSGLADEAQRFWKLKSRPHVIYNGLDIEVIEKKSRENVKHPWLNDKKVPLIVSVGRLVPSKGFTNLIKSISIVNQTVKVRLLIIGDHKRETHKYRLLDQIDGLKLGDCVSLVGEKPNPYPFMKAADLYVSSSLYEGFSNSLLEALALGLPIVSTDHKFGANEMIEDGKSGLLIPVANPKAMAGAIVRVLKDSELREKLSQNARERAQSFTLEKAVSEYEKLFRKVVESFGGQSG